MYTCFVACPAFRSRETMLWTRFILGFWSFSKTLAHIHRAGLDDSLFCLDNGSRFVKRDIRIGAFCWSSSHTLSHVKCSTAGFDLSRKREWWLSEQIGTIPCRLTRAANFTAIWGRRVVFSTAAWAIELRLPRPTNRPSFLRELVRGWYLFRVVWLTTTLHNLQYYKIICSQL